MPEPALPALVRRLAHAAAGPALADRSDADLLREFAAGRDEAAFAELVARRGPLVLDVCRAVLGNHADADDAFQATFLLLARNAGTVRRPASLAAWLHGVAHRVALKARSRAARRRDREARLPAPEAATPPGDPSWAEVRAAVHDELARLGERYRAVLVLCYLDGLTHGRAAEALGLSSAAVKKRLERGRAMLRSALARRGIGPTAVLAAVALPAAVPPALAASAARLATQPAAIPAHVHALTRGATPMTTRTLAAALCLLPALVAGAVLAAPPEPPRPATAPPAPAAVPVDDKPAAKAATELDGAWSVRHVETGGEAVVNHRDLAEARITFQGDRATVTGLKVLFFGDFTFKLDPAQKPKSIDVTFLGGEMKGKTFEGVYIVRKDEARLCLRLTHPERGRPKGFATSGGTTLYTFILWPTREGDAPGAPDTRLKAAATCRVTGSLTSTEYGKLGGTLDRGIVSVLADPGGERVAHSDTKRTATGPEFAFDLFPGRYVLECTGVGSRGATFVPTRKAITVGPADTAVKLDPIDLPASEITRLFGKPAPELDGVVGWKNTDPVTLKGLKGKVVVLDFWSYSCSICLVHKPDLARLAEKYADKGVAVLTVHDASADTIAEVEQKLPDAVKRKAGHLPVALDGKGAKGVFRAYGVHAVPTVILVGPDGTVVRRFHHAGDPELDREVGKLLGTAK